MTGNDECCFLYKLQLHTLWDLDWGIAYFSLSTYKFRNDLLSTRQSSKLGSDRSAANSTKISTIWTKKMKTQKSACMSANCQIYISFTCGRLKDRMLVLSHLKVSHCSGTPRRVFFDRLILKLATCENRRVMQRNCKDETFK